MSIFLKFRFVYKIVHFAGPRGDVTAELPDISQQKSNKGSTLSKISTQKYKYQQKYATFFIENLMLWRKSLLFGITVICGSLFTGTLYGSIRAIYYYNESDPWFDSKKAQEQAFDDLCVPIFKAMNPLSILYIS